MSNWYVKQSGVGNGQTSTTPMSPGSFASAAILPGDTVHLQGAITDQLTCPRSGTSSSRIIITGDGVNNGNTFRIFNFNGKSWVTLLNARVQDNAGNYPTPNINIGDTCHDDIVDGVHCYGPSGPAVVKATGNPYNITVQNCKFLDIVRFGIEFEGTDNGQILNNTITSRQACFSGSDTDLIRFDWSTNTLIKGNYLKLQLWVQLVNSSGTQLSGGHNDCIQCFKPHVQPGVVDTRRPINATIQNNFLELADVKTVGGDGVSQYTGSQLHSGYWNFFMVQNLSGTFDVIGNVFLARDWHSGTIETGSSPQDLNTDRVDARFINNTFISLRGGAKSPILATLRPNPNATGPWDAHLTIINNAFYNGWDNNGNPITQDFDQYAGCTYVANHNAIFGWNAGTTGSWTDRLRNFNASDFGYVTTAGSENFALGVGSPLLGAGVNVSGTANGGNLADSSTFALPTSAQISSWPNPPTQPAGTTPDIGAWQASSATSAPSFTSVNNATFTQNSAGSFTVRVNANPTCTSISRTAGATLPSGISLFYNGNNTATLSGTTSAASGDYVFTITATNSAGSTNQSFTLTIQDAVVPDLPPTFDGPFSFVFAQNTPGSFLITVTASPTATSISRTGGSAIPAGLSLVYNNDNTATLSGTPTVAGSSSPIITATNSGGSTAQTFTINVEAPPPPPPPAAPAIMVLRA